jgi:hypothetical protein
MGRGESVTTAIFRYLGYGHVMNGVHTTSGLLFALTTERAPIDRKEDKEDHFYA